MGILIREETSTDHAAVQNIHLRAFGREDEARLVEALRTGGFARVSMVAEEDGHVVGHVLFSALPIRTAEGIVESLTLAPLAVLPSHQRRGIGSWLTRGGLRVARERNQRSVIVLGSPEFYLRFGFSAKRAETLKAPFSGPAFMGIELVPGALAGIEGEVCYPPPFGGLDHS